MSILKTTSNIYDSASGGSRLRIGIRWKNPVNVDSLTGISYKKYAIFNNKIAANVNASSEKFISRHLDACANAVSAVSGNISTQTHTRQGCLAQGLSYHFHWMLPSTVTVRKERRGAKGCAELKHRPQAIQSQAKCLFAEKFGWKQNQ